MMGRYLSNIKNEYRRARDFASRIARFRLGYMGRENTNASGLPTRKSEPSGHERWRDPKSYSPYWARRAKMAAEIIPSDSSILEIGVGTGSFRDCVEHRCRYEGADLAPLDDTTLALDLDADALPDKIYDFVVVLGVIEYLQKPEDAVRKICAAAPNVICSYCCQPSRASIADVADHRRSMGWLNSFTRDEFIGLFRKNDFFVQSSTVYSSTGNFGQILTHFRKNPSLIEGPAP